MMTFRGRWPTGWLRQKMTERKRGARRTSIVVMLPAWTFMTAVWIRSKPEPVTTMFLPPLKYKNAYRRTQWNRAAEISSATQKPKVAGRKAQFLHGTLGNFHRRWKQISWASEEPIWCLLLQSALLIIHTHRSALDCTLNVRGSFLRLTFICACDQAVWNSIIRARFSQSEETSENITHINAGALSSSWRTN